MTPPPSYGILTHMKQPYPDNIRKITANLPAGLLQELQETTGLGVSETLRASLLNFKKTLGYEKMRSLRGKLSFEIDVNELREDR